MKKNTHYFLITLLILLCFLGYQYPIFFDATFNKNNSLDHANLEFLATIDKPLPLNYFLQIPLLKKKYKA